MLTSKRAIRILFLLLILVLPAQLVVKQLAGGEPYPALFLPSFAQVFERNSAIVFNDAQVIGVLADGTEMILDHRKVMPGGGGNVVVFQTIFSNQRKVTSTDSVEWLRGQLAAAYPGVEFTSVFVQSRKWQYDTVSGERTLVGTKGGYPVVFDE